MFHLYSRDQSTKYSIPSNEKLLYHKWYHIAGSYDTTGVAVLFVDGIQVGNKTDIRILELKTEYDLWLGYLFKGRLSRVRIFNVSLSEKEVKEVMDAMKPSLSE